MKTYRWFGLLLAVFWSSGAFDARATFLAGSGDPFTLNFDENGNGQLDLRDGFGFQNHPGFLAPDPTQGGIPELTYFLPGPIVNGDIRIWEDTSHTILSDVMRFTDAAGNLTGQTADRMIYYSEFETNQPNPDLADAFGFPPLVPNDAGGINEVGIEGNNGFQWAPGGVFDNIYNGISDVPEPGTLALLGLGAGLLAIYRRNRKG